jgi:hypothetical protein
MRDWSGLIWGMREWGNDPFFIYDCFAVTKCGAGRKVDLNNKIKE